jgi:tetratricopeptide (TPR) repeat protein
MSAKSNSRKNLHPLLAAVAAVVLPSLALAQGQIDVGRANDANNQVGSSGRNGNGAGSSYYGGNLSYGNMGNRIVTGNVSQGREFRGNVGYTDPYAFRGPTAGAVSDNFAKNSVGVPRPNSAPVVPNTSVPFYGSSQTVAPPPGFQLNATRTGYVPPPPTAGFRPAEDQRIGIVDLNQPISPSPTPGSFMMRGSLNPQQAAETAGVLTGSTLYGVREWNPQDPADRAFLQDAISRQGGLIGPTQIDPREVRRMRDELERAILPDRVDNAALGQRQGGQGAAGRSADSLTLDPIGGRTLESPASAAVNNRPLDAQVEARPLNDQGVNTEQGIRDNLLGRARRTSTQYTELNRRLDQYYTERRKTDADFAREFNAEKKRQDEAKAKGAETARGATAGANNPNNPNAPQQPGKQPGGPGEPGKAPAAVRPQPVKVTSLATGVRGEGLANVLKKAETLMKEGKYTSALDQYDAAEAVTPNNPLIWLGRAHAELGAGFFLRADGHLRQALSADHALLMGQYDLTAMLGEDRLTKLVSELKDQANRDTTKSTPLFLLAYIAYNTGHEQQALGYLDLAEQRGGDPGGFFKLLKEHWALPEAGGAPAGAKPEQTAPKTDAAPATETPKPELNK